MILLLYHYCIFNVRNKSNHTISLDHTFLYVSYWPVDAATRGLMFGIPLSQCLTNDRQLAKWQSSSVVTTPTRVTSGVPDDSNYLRLPRVRYCSYVDIEFDAY